MSALGNPKKERGRTHHSASPFFLRDKVFLLRKDISTNAEPPFPFILLVSPSNDALHFVFLDFS